MKNEKLLTSTSGLHRSIKKSFPVILLLLLTLSAAAQSLDKSKLDLYFNRLSEKNKAMGSIALFKDDKVLYTRSIGFDQPNGSASNPLTAESKYRIGSITKMFTAVMIFQLVEEGKLSLNTPLARFFPQVPDADRITIEHLLGHRSGIQELTANRDFRGRRFDDIPKDEVVTLIAKSPLAFQPGSKYSYSSSGYFLLGYIIEKLSGQSYQDALRNRITERIGLKNTYAGTGKIQTSNKEVNSYRYTSKWEQQPETNMSILFGSGSLVSTVNDQAIFIQSLFNGKLIAQQSLEKMKLNLLGLDTFSYNNRRFYGHTGGIDGFGAWLAYQPQEKVTLSYATNGKAYPVAKMMEDVMNVYYNSSFQISDFESFQVSTEVLDRYTGVYTREGAPVTFTISREGDKLFAQPTGQSPIALEAVAPDAFKIESMGIEILFDTEKKTMTIKRNGGERVFVRQD